MIRSGARILEIGAGGENPTSNCLSQLGPTTGLDISDEVLGNRALSEAYVYDGDSFPFPDASFDFCVSNFVLEHVKDPETQFREVHRVLAMNGAYLLRTPNLLHYTSLAAWVLPNALHGVSNRLRGFPPGARAPFPTFYRANTAAKLKGYCARVGLEVVFIRMIEKEPSYGRLHPALFYPMMVYERCVNAFERLAPFRSNIIALLRKPQLELTTTA
jgi:SAM-dependent methyltransferase